jgi:hypothetical protein
MRFTTTSLWSLPGSVQPNLVNRTLVYSTPSILRHIFARPKFLGQNYLFYTATTLNNTTFRNPRFVILKRHVMLNNFSSMLCTSKIHSFSLGNYLGNSPIIGNLMRIRVTSVQWTWLGLEWPST